MTPVDFYLFMLWFFGFLVGRRIFPLKKSRYVKWWYRRKGIAYYICNIIDGNTLDHTQVVKVGSEFYEYDGGKYYLYDKNKATQYTPCITIEGENNVFHLKDNINPLVVGPGGLTPAYNDPSIFASFINSKTLSNTLHPETAEILQIKRFVLISTMLTIGIITMVIYYFFGKIGG